jgi:hypothetical protein
MTLAGVPLASGSHGLPAEAPGTASGRRLRDTGGGTGHRRDSSDGSPRMIQP